MADDAPIKATVSGPSGRNAGPAVTPDEVAAVVAALTVVTSGGVADVSGRPTPRWRFSGRWWTKPVPSRRGRPDPRRRGDLRD
jgi:hypothetical protein